MACQAFLVCQSREMKVMSSPFSHYVTYRLNRDGSAAGREKGDTDYSDRERERERSSEFKCIDCVVEFSFLHFTMIYVGKMFTRLWFHAIAF